MSVAYIDNIRQNTINSMTMVSFGLGNIIGTEIFQPKDAPAYIPGKIAILVLLTAQLFVCYLLRWINIGMNKKKHTKLEEEKARNGWTDEDVKRERERHAFMDLTDKQYVVSSPFGICIVDCLLGTHSSCTSHNMYSSGKCVLPATDPILYHVQPVISAIASESLTPCYGK